MALRAGYKGFKKLLSPLKIIRPGTLGIDNDILIPELNKTFFPRSEQAVLGARNLVKFPYVKLDGSYSAVSVTVNNDGSLLLNGTASADAFIIFHVRQGASPTDNNPVILKAGTYNVYKGDNANDVSLRLNKTVSGNAVTLVELSGTTKKGSFTLTEETQIGMIIDITNGAAVTNNVVKPMITFGDDKNETITPYAMTNRELTENKLEVFEINSAVDLDNIIQTGMYIVKNTSTGNRPVNTPNMFTLFVIKFSDIFYQQIVVEVTGVSEKIYTRRYGGDPLAWSSWYKIEGTAVS